MLRRTFLLTSAAAAGAAASAANKPIESITRQPDLYHGWPTLARRPDSGELLVVYSGGRESHICPYGRVELIRSHDDGRSWTFPEVLLDTPIDDRDAGICVTPAGLLLVTTFTSNAYERQLQRHPKWLELHNRVDEAGRKKLLDCWMLRSTDGLTWSAPYRVPVNSPHGPIALKNGKLLYPGKQLWTGGRIGVCTSSDDGLTWQWLATIPTRAGEKFEDYHELHAVETTTGRILVHIRNQNPANDRETLQSESDDGGKTWSVPHAIGVWGLPSHLLRLRDGRILMTYGYRRKPFGNQARISADHGATWSDPIVISDDGPGVDLGYPSTVELADGSLLTVWYETTAAGPKAILRQTRWRL